MSEMRARAERRVHRRVFVATAAGLLAVVAAAGPAPRLVWNASASAPTGLYWVVRDGAIDRGQLVLADAPDGAAALAAARGYLPAGARLVKRVAAVVGDAVCVDAGIVAIDGRAAAAILRADRAGRPLPSWRGCRRLGAGEVFLLMEGVADSFDSRYFGPVDRSAVQGRLVPLWTS